MLQLQCKPGGADPRAISIVLARGFGLDLGWVPGGLNVLPSGVCHEFLARDCYIPRNKHTLESSDRVQSSHRCRASWFFYIRKLKYGLGQIP